MRGEIGTVVATAGTTSFGAVDPIEDIIALGIRYGFRVHVDAAYGGYFAIADTLPSQTRRDFDAISRADSIAIDPHKHGLQPYGCGCILFADPALGRHYQHDSPYTYFTSDELHLGEISLECSRAGAAAVALWATQRLLPMQRGAAFGGMLDDCLAAARALADSVTNSTQFELVQAPALDIVVWAVRDASISSASARAKRIFDKAAERGLHLALIDVDVARLPATLAGMTRDGDTLTCLRSCLMKPEHRDWVARIFDIVEHAAAD